MEDTRWLRFITIGLVLAAMAIAYFLLTQRFSGSKTSQPSSSPEVVAVPSRKPLPSAVLGLNTTVSPSPSTQATQSAYQRVAAGTTKGGLTQLPSTGFPIALVGIFSLGGAVAGWGLRKFPH